MAKQRDNFRLGLTVIVMFALALAVVLFIGGEGLFKEPVRPLIVRFAAEPGMPEIVPGSRVVCFGQAVGKVVDTGYVLAVPPGDSEAPEAQYLEVHANALASLDLRNDCKVIATGPPLGGKGAIEIANRGVSPDKLPDDKRIYGEIVGFQTALTQLNNELDTNNPAGLLSLIKVQLDASEHESIIAKIHESLTHVSTMTAELADELDRTQQDHLLYKVHASLAKIDMGLAEIVSVLQDNRKNIDNTLASVEHATATIDARIVPRLADELDNNNEKALLSQAHTAFQRLDRSLADLNDVTAATRRVVAINVDRIDELVENASEASMVLKSGIQDLALHPWKLIFEPAANEKRELHVLEIARQFAEAAAHLDDATTRLRALSEASTSPLPGDDAELQEIRAQLDESVKKYYEAENALWKELKAD